MPIINRIAEFHADMTAWRRDLHAHPEIAFEEARTSDVVADLLASFGLEVHRGLAKTGVVATLEGRFPGDGAIGLRADMDALPMMELNDIEHRSVNDGKMHACGHDGHTTMLLGAAKYLAETRNFVGKVQFIFQPAEEMHGGGRVMVEEGLFDDFPVDAVYGMHNWPGHPAGEFAVAPGPIMAAADVFQIVVTGHGAHGAMPHLGVDPVLVAAEIVTALQSIVSRTNHPIEAAVVSVTQFHAGEADNVIPQTARLRGTARAFKTEIRDLIETSMRRIAENIAAAHGATCEVSYARGYPPTINSAAETELAARAAAVVVGDERVARDPVPSMGAEDFSYMLEARPGCYIWLGNGPGDGGCMLHNPLYDFNDEILPVGASYWATLVETTLARPD